jgi:nucleoside-diphosphate-sugar epimerase
VLSHPKRRDFERRLYFSVSSNFEKGIAVKVLVTGAAGFLGGHLVRKLVALGHTVMAMGRCPIPGQFESMENLVWIDRDIAADGISPDEIASVDAVFHLAAVTSGTDEWRYLMANEATTVRLLQACATNHPKIIFASSQMVYGDVKHTAVSEDFSLQSSGSAYACSKINGENWLRFFQEEFGGLYVILRLTGFIEGGGMVDYIINRGLRNEPVELFSRGVVQRDYLSVEKAVEAFISVLHYEKSAGFELFNIGSGQAVTSYDLAKLIFTELDSTSEVVLSSYPALKRDFVFDIKKAVKCLNFDPGDLQESVRRYASKKKVAFERNDRSAKN